MGDETFQYRDEIHVVHVDPAADVFNVLHPRGCNVSLNFRCRVVTADGTELDSGGPHTVVYECATEHDLDELGYDDPLFTTPGWFAVQPWVSKSPGGPWGPTEYDTGLEVTPLTDFIAGAE